MKKVLVFVASFAASMSLMAQNNPFGGGHTLMPLDELEAYVGEHSHLPGVPSAAEVEEQGADLGEMNKVLMEKVEELTLYIIDLQKQINELKSNK